MSQEIRKIQLQVGQTVDSHYKIEKLLGAGSFGDVFLVRDTCSQTLYAMKMLRMWSMAPDVQENLRRRFELEYNIGRIQSDFLVQSRSYGELAGNPYILMEYCPDGDLLKQSQCPGYKIDFSKVALNVLMGLEALHQSGRVHRDLKPENVLIKPDGTPCEDGEKGEIVVRTGNGKPVGLFKEYYRDEELSHNVWHDDVYHTGDVAWRDEDGYYWFEGRIDDVIKSSGYRIGPFEVESALMTHPAVVECAITGVPDEIRGMVVKATVVLHKDWKAKAGEDLIKELQNHVKHVTAPYKYPRIIEFVDELPKTISGKIRRVEIREKDMK